MQEEEFNARGKFWLGCAVAAVFAFCLLSGQYFSIGIDEDIDDLDAVDEL